MSVLTAPKSSDSLTNCFLLTRIGRLLRKKAKKDIKVAEVVAEIRDIDMVACEEVKIEDGRDDDWMAALRKYVKMLHFGRWEEKEAAAREMKKLAEDVKRRRTMVELGVIPPLVAMVGSEVVARRRLAVRALIEISKGSFT